MNDEQKKKISDKLMDIIFLTQSVKESCDANKLFMEKRILDMALSKENEIYEELSV